MTDTISPGFSGTIARTPAERLVRRCLLRHRGAVPFLYQRCQRLFSISMVISGLRCLVSYVVLPFLAPAIGAATGVEPYLGIPMEKRGRARLECAGPEALLVGGPQVPLAHDAVYVAVMGLVAAVLVGDICAPRPLGVSALTRRAPAMQGEAIEEGV